MSQSDFVSRGQALVAAGQFQEAVKVCRLGLLGRPTTVEGRVVLGQALLALKRFDEVLAEMRVALELDHSSLPAQVLKAEALLRKGDTVPAIEVLHKAREAAPGDPRILQLLGEAEKGGAPRASVSHPAVGFVGNGDTKHYPGHSAASGDESSGPGGYTRPTTLQSPAASQRSAHKATPIDDSDADGEDTDDAAPRPEALLAKVPLPGILPVAERTGTVEVDPHLEGVEVDDEDFDDGVAAPPVPKPGQKPGVMGGARGSVKTSSKVGSSAKSGISKADRAGGMVSGKKAVVPNPTMELDLPDENDPELIEARQLESRAPGPKSDARAKGKSVPPPRGNPNAPFVPSIANAPNAALSSTLPPAAPLPPAPKSARPAMGGTQPPPPFVSSPPFAAAPPPPPPPPPAANLPTMAVPAKSLSAAQQASADAVEQLFGSDGAAPGWGRAPAAAPPNSRSANEPTARPGELDPAILALMSGGAPGAGSQYSSGAMPIDPSLGTPPRGAQMKSGRKGRSRLAVAMWFIVGVLVIGGGVFAGFQIRAMRLQKQIATARQRATDLAKTDTWSGWTAARESLANIVHAKGTLPNRAALARARALIAYEYGDGLAEAKAAVDELAAQGGLDGNLAAAFLALAQDDAKGAKASADAALAIAPNDPAAQYALAEVALLAGDAKTAVAQMKAVADKDARPLYGIGLARAQAAAYNWDEAIAALDRVLSGSPDHPAAVIVRAEILVSSGRLTSGALANEVRAQVDRIAVEGRRPVIEQQHGVSPTQVAFAYLSLARVELARGDLSAARRALKFATDVNLDDQRFSEDTLDVLVMLGDLTTARSLIDPVLKAWPASRSARITLAQIYIAQGHAADAVELLAKATDVLALPDGLTVRGQAELASGDAANAALDFDAALKKLPTHEPAIIGRAWLELATGDVDAATKRVGERYNAKGSSAALTLVYAATLRRSADPAVREKAKPLLEKLVKGSGPEVAIAQLELARTYRDSGDFPGARAAYNDSARAGNVDARIELALLSIEDQKPLTGRDMLDALLKEAGEHPTPQLVIEGARARMLAGDHTGADKLLELADKTPGVDRWKLDRERARLALRKSQFPVAAAALARALDGCGGDAETFLLAADAANAEATLGDKIRKLAPERLKGRPELAIVNGRLLLAATKDVEAEAAFRSAKDALKAEKASLRRIAQADFGLALIAANRNNIPEAIVLLELVMQEDPSIVDTYIFAADLVQTRPRETRKAFEYARKATELNPDYAYAWLAVGKLAQKLGDKRTLSDAIGRLQNIAPNGDELKELQTLRGGK